MAFAATAIGRLRTSGNNANGSFYDSSVANVPSTTLNGSLTNSTTTVVVTSATNWPTSGNYYARIGNVGAETTGGSSEVVLVTAGQGTTSWTVTRGQLGTTAIAFATGIVVDNSLTQCDTAIASSSDGVSTASTTFTSATGAFNKTYIGLALRLASGTGTPDVGYYFVQSVTNATTLVLDRVSGTYTAGVWKIGGAAADFAAAMFVVGNATGNKLIAGNTVYVRGAGTDTPSSTDYTITAWVDMPDGTSSAAVRITGENGRPYVTTTDSIAFYQPGYYTLTKVALKMNYSAGPNALFWYGNNVALIDCVFYLNGKAAPLIQGTQGLEVIACEIDGGCTGTLSGNTGIIVDGNGGFVIGCYIHDTGSMGISMTANGWQTVSGNIIKTAWGVGINCAVIGFPSKINNNTIYNGQSDGIVITAQTGVNQVSVYNNIVSKHIVGSPTGIKVTSGTAATSDNLKTMIDYNCVHNCSTRYAGISAGAHDIADVDPAFTNAGSGDFTLGSSSPCKATGFPGQFLNGGNNISYVDMGAVQRQEPAGGSGPTSFTFA